MFHRIERFFSRSSWSWMRALGHALYWFRSHTFDRRHVIDISGQEEYRWGWIDRDHAMLLCCFKLLCDYVDEEKPFEHLVWDEDEKHISTKKEIEELYHWWKVGRKADHDLHEELISSVWRDHPQEDGEDPWASSSKRIEDPRWKRWMEWYHGVHAKDDEMLMRLMKIRGSLWT